MSIALRSSLCIARDGARVSRMLPGLQTGACSKKGLPIPNRNSGLRINGVPTRSAACASALRCRRGSCQVCMLAPCACVQRRRAQISARCTRAGVLEMDSASDRECAHSVCVCARARAHARVQACSPPSLSLYVTTINKMSARGCTSRLSRLPAGRHAAPSQEDAP
jgi:hypothetical protein